MEDDGCPPLLPLPFPMRRSSYWMLLQVYLLKIVLLFCCNIDGRLFRSKCGDSSTRDLCARKQIKACLAVSSGCNHHLMSTHVALEVKCRKNTRILLCQKSDNDWYISGMLPKDSV